jgi:signal transduction histidine kinase
MEDLLDFNRLEHGGVQLKLDRHEAGEITRAALNSLMPLFEEKAQALIFNPEPLIFNRYYRRPFHEQESKVSGIGLGLPITRNLVELHRGKIWVEGRPGAGTTFFVQLPLALVAFEN